MADRAARSLATREAILGAAAVEFARYGFSGARLERVIEVTGYTKGAVYFHFDSKKAMAEAVLEGRFDAWPKLVEDVREQGGRGLSGMRLLALRVTLMMATNMRIRAGMRLSQELRLVPDGFNPYDAWADRFVPFLEEAISDGDAPASLNCKRAAKTVVNCLFGVLQVAIDAGTEDQIDAELEALWRLITPGLRTGGAG